MVLSREKFIQMSNSVIPEKYLNSLKSILEELELETGLMFQITIEQFGKSFSHNENVIGDFTKRKNRLEVFETEPDYDELLGIYESRDDIKKRIDNLRHNLLFSETKEYDEGGGYFITIGKCIKCNKYKNKKGAQNYVLLDCCQNCRHNWRDNKWNKISISNRDNIIYTIVGRSGRYNEIKTIAKYRFC